ncbi:MAG: DUF5343 domain-containing protein [Gemmatimonadota bacterium]|nr:DUF5343 domain-containing protein [Gemmatimonadota bacterium]
MEEVRQDAAETAAEEGLEENSGRQDRAWFPYITKVQFERFLSRLETKIPDQIDRDYVRPIIRTPSMIHRFLRGIESMNLTDRDQKPTDLLLRIVPKDTRKFAIAEVVRDLYKDLLPEWEQNNGNMSDDAIVDYFRNRTGMGRDSANKMKMFFKYLIAEADFGDPSEPQEEAAAEPEPQEPEPQEETPEPEPKKEARSAREPAPKERSGRDGRTKRTTSERQERQQQERQERSERSSDRQERPLTETQRAYLETLQSMVQIKIDGDWDEDMIRLAFDRLERLFDRLRRA